MSMKKIVFILSIACLLFGLNACKSKSKEQADSNVEITSMCGNSMISLDWAGTYTGVIPCADCPGIEVQITLNKDNTFEMTRKYQDRNVDAFVFSGTFSWNDAGSIITLNGLDANAYPTQYQVGENVLFQLDLEGNRITGDLAENYMLTKIE